MDVRPTDNHHRLLRRCLHRRLLGGVAAGAADYLEIDVTTARIALVVLALIGGLVIPLYIAAWLLVPEEESETSIADNLIGDYWPARQSQA